MKLLKPKILFALTTILLICASLLFLFLYEQSPFKKVDDPLEVKSMNVVRKLLIATEASPFKDSINAQLLDHYKSSRVLVEIIDVRDLGNADAANYDAILILHRWEAGAPIDIVQSFMEKNLESNNKIVMLTTSWNGLEKMENIDAITGASIIKDVPNFTAKITKRLDGLFKYKK
ncbi:MAG TPA: hypothetical protein VKX40_07355 [Aequorivita sp.]|nr:hypothetical protein [Aequorivita sp.]